MWTNREDGLMLQLVISSSQISPASRGKKTSAPSRQACGRTEFAAGDGGAESFAT